MKKILFLATLALIVFAACHKDSSMESVIEESGDFIASFAATRTALDGTAVTWCQEDLLTIFTKTSHNRKYQIKELSDDCRSATFSYVSFTGNDDAKISSNYALFPYDADATLTGGVITTTLQATQTYDRAKGNLRYALMSSTSATNSFSFRNAGSLLRFKVSKIVPDKFILNSIKIKSASSNIAGEVTIDLNGTEAKAFVTANGVKEITLADIDTEITTDVQMFYVAMPSISFSDKDLTVTFVFDQGEKVFELPAFDLEQGKIKGIAYEINDSEDFTGSTPDSGEIVPIAKPADNEIWYTTTNGEKASHHPNINNISSEVYDDEKGVWIMTFSRPITSLRGEGELFLSSKVKTIILPESITHMDYMCFVNLTNLTNINIPKGVTIIKDRTFSGCSGLTEIVIPDSVTEIERCAFEGCSSLADVVLGNNVKTIGDEAFKNCAPGMNINIPAGIENLGNMLCNQSAKVRFESDLPPATLSNRTFLYECTFYVPAGSRDAYREILKLETEPSIVEY